ncbi:MAG: hypothetical protein DHS20C05_01890 [Hyphococcus sp.]|nr:MAG: hypothetical protein DHS20C05_01890 [Marinicaulis sp.]
MNNVAGEDKRINRSGDDDGVSASLQVILTTQATRYVTITSWALLLLAIVDISTVVIWYGLTMAAGATRSLIEKRMRDRTDAPKDPNHRRYAYIAMASCAFWAVAPVLAAVSGHPLGIVAALFFIVNGYMLAFSQFRTTPVNALIVTSPYAVAYLTILILCFGDAAFILLLAALPVLITSISYVLMFGHLSQQELNRANRERAALIEELESARIAAEKASEAKSMFLANMSHEIRTPMNGVLGMAELLAGTKLNTRQRVFADTIHKSGGALLTIINDILDFSKIEAGKLELEEAPFDLQSSVEDVAALVASKAQEKEIEMIVRYQPDLPNSLMGDGGRVRQVITNLVGNAVKFTRKGYVLIDVSGKEDGDMVSCRIEVKDTGVGIEASKIGRIFDAFQQADTTTTREFGGTGLGLSISKKLVEAMNGRIGATSKVDHGSTFWIEFEMPKSGAAPTIVPISFDADGRRVLVVDDIAVNRQIVTEQLSAWGFSCDAAASGEEALGMLKKAQAEKAAYDLAILDYLMPQMDGEELARRIKADPELADISLLVLTSVDRSGDARRFKEIGAEGYLVKPARAALIQETISNILHKQEVIDEERLTEDTTVAPISQNASMVVSDKTRVLLAEDNEVNQLVIKHMLDPNTYDLIVANNGKEALQRFETSETGFDIILMDVSMPELDGYEATRAIRAIEQGAQKSHTPIVCLTAHVMASDIERSNEAGMDDFLAKPVSKDKLMKVVERWSSHENEKPRRATG